MAMAWSSLSGCALLGAGGAGGGAGRARCHHDLLCGSLGEAILHLFRPPCPFVLLFLDYRELVPSCRLHTYLHTYGHTYDTGCVWYQIRYILTVHQISSWGGEARARKRDEVIIISGRAIRGILYLPGDVPYDTYRHRLKIDSILLLLPSLYPWGNYSVPNLQYIRPKIRLGPSSIVLLSEMAPVLPRGLKKKRKEKKKKKEKEKKRQLQGASRVDQTKRRKLLCSD